jgi:hypothetical protein
MGSNLSKPYGMVARNFDETRDDETRDVRGS